MGKSTWRRFLVVGLAGVALGALLPPAAGEVVAQAVNAMSVVAVAVVVRRRRPDHARAWWLFVAGGALFLVGNLVLAVHAGVASTPNPFPSPADAFYVLGYVGLIAGEVLLVRRRSAAIEGDNLIDSLILATCVGVLVWAHVLVPYAEDPALSLAETLLSVAYSVLVLILVAVAARLAVGSGRRNPSYYLLAGSLTFIVISDALATVSTAAGARSTVVVVTSALSYVLFAAGALHPSMPRLTDRPAEREIQLTSRRLAMLLAAVLFVPAILVVEAVGGRRSNMAVMAAGSVVLTVLVLARLAGLVRAKERKVVREQVLRRAGSQLVTATSTEQIHEGALVAFRALMGSDQSARVSIACGSPDSLTVVAAGEQSSQLVGTRIAAAALPLVAREALRHGHTAVLDNSSSPAPALPAPLDGDRVVIVPLSTKEGVRGAVFLTPGRVLEVAARVSVETLANQVSLALESAALTEEVHQRRHERRFRALVENSFDMISVIGPDGTSIFVSPTSAVMLGVPESEMVGEDAFARVHAEDRARAHAMLDRCRSEQGAHEPMEARYRHTSGEWRWFEIVAVNLLDEPEVAGIVVHARDITDRKEARLRMEESEARFRSLVQHASDVVIVLDEELTMTYVSPSVARILGHTPEELMETSWFDLVHPEDAVRARNLTGDAPSQHDVELRVRHRDGSWHTVDLTVSDLRHDTAVGGIVLNGRDVTERLVLESQLRHQALHDDLTGLANRTLFTDRVDHALSRRAGTFGGVVVLFIDLDDFKTVNDSLGHAAGDALLNEFASRLSGALRSGDTAARIGGDEFAILLENVEDLETVLDIVNRVQESLRAPFAVANRTWEVKASIGIARDQGDLAAADVLLRNADVAMYQAKSKGKNRHELFEADMQVMVRERFELKGDLARAIEEQQFHILYQPIVSLSRGEMTALEALVRWEHPNLGLVCPDNFIPLAEETGHIVPLGLWVLEQACGQLSRWRDKHPHRHSLAMSVNVSVRQLEDPGFLAQVKAALHHSAIPPRSLHLEITESILMADVEVTSQRLTQLKGLDVVLAVDDFGMGHSSLGYLQGFPVDVLKIDRRFIGPLGREPQQANLIKGIINLARSLGLRTVAEGIEEPEQATILRALGCDEAQGYHYSPPVPAGAIDALLEPEPVHSALG